MGGGRGKTDRHTQTNAVEALFGGKAALYLPQEAGKLSIMRHYIIGIHTTSTRSSLAITIMAGCVLMLLAALLSLAPATNGWSHGRATCECAA